MTGTFVESGASFALVPRLTPSKAEDTGGEGGRGSGAQGPENGLEL